MKRTLYFICQFSGRGVEYTELGVTAPDSVSSAIAERVPTIEAGLGLAPLAHRSKQIRLS
jgi:hypothetical protein